MGKGLPKFSRYDSDEEYQDDWRDHKKRNRAGDHHLERRAKARELEQRFEERE